VSELIPLRRPGAGVGERHELHVDFDVAPFDLYGRRHEVAQARADIGITRLSEGLHLDLRLRVVLRTTCDRTLDPTHLQLEFGDSVFLSGPNNHELAIEDWTLDLRRYTERALPNEVPMQVFGPGTDPVELAGGSDEIDPRWRGLGGLFASGF
jgi:DUF177 domain-containing protein